MTEKEVDKINEEYRKDQIPDTHGDYSGADKSLITHPDEDAKRSAVEGMIAELGNHTVEIDGIKASINVLSEQQTQIAQMINQQTQAINNIGQGNVSTANVPGPPTQGLNMESLSALGDLLEKGIGAYKQLKGGPPTETPLISENFIKERMVKSFMDDLDTGTSITNFIKDSLKKKVTKEVINTTFRDMGNTNDTHAPQ